MPYSKNILYSPLTPHAVAESRGASLLLQFLLSEILACYQAVIKEIPLEQIHSSAGIVFPFDWSIEIAPLNKIEEHAHLLPSAFPHLKEELSQFQTCLENFKNRYPLSHSDLFKELQTLYTHLFPFLRSSKNSSTLLFFLVKHKEALEALSSAVEFTALLEEMFPEGWEATAEEIYKKCKQLNLSHLEQSFARYAK